MGYRPQLLGVTRLNWSWGLLTMVTKRGLVGGSNAYGIMARGQTTFEAGSSKAVNDAS